MESNTGIIKICYLCTTKSDEKVKGRFSQKRLFERLSEGMEKIFVDHDQKG